MPTVVDKLANGIRTRQHQCVEEALRQGASPNANISLDRHERFGADQAPVIYLAIHYDMPETVRLLVQSGARVHSDLEGGVTPRAHAAWRFRWACVDVFDEIGQEMQDDGIVLSVIATHWSQPQSQPHLEDMFFRRMDHVSRNFLMTPDLALSFVVGVLCGWEGYRVPQLRKLLSYGHFQDIGKQMHPAMHETPTRFAPHYAKMHRQAQTFLGAQALPDPALELMAQFGIPLAPPEQAGVNAEACAWLEQQQARVDALTCRKALADTTVEVGGQGKARGRL